MEIVPVSALRDNYIWALCEGTNCAVVDPGDAVPVEAFLHDTGRTLTAVLLTHHHHDHVDGVHALVNGLGIPVFGPDSPLMPMVNFVVHDDESVHVPGIASPLRVLAVPGHTEEHIAWLHGDKSLFCGDTLFGAGCGRLLGGTAEELHASLQRLGKLSPSTRVYCAHEYTLANLRFALTVEPANAQTSRRHRQCELLRAAGMVTLPSTIEEEQATNPFLRTRSAAVRAAVECAAGGRLESDVEVFAALRAWKDRF